MTDFMKGPKIMRNLVLLLFILTLNSPLMAQDVARGKELYAQCIQCHGENGEGNIEKNAPRIGGQHDWYILLSLNNFKSRERKNPDMMPFIKNLSEKDFQDLAAYVSQL